MATLRNLTATLLLAVPLLLAGCAGREPSFAGSYRASLQLPGGELPFGLEIEGEGTALRATVVNGPERIEVTEARVDDGQLTLQMPGFGTRLVLRREGGLLRGEVKMVKSGRKDQSIPLVATPGSSYRFFPAATTPGANVGGRWAVTFTEDDGTTWPAVGEFAQQDGDVTGTFLAVSGDHRYLTGELRDGELFLGSFNGGQAFLYRGRLQADGSVQGEYWSGLAYHARFAGRRDEAASLADVAQATSMRDASQPLAFSFPDLEGKPVSLADERYRGKVVVVTIAGSWCPNCHDEAQFLAPYWNANRDAGLEVVGLMFEHFETTPEAVEAVKRFRDRNGATYPLLLAGITGATASEKMPQLNRISAYPTTLFVDRKGLVRHVHTGFSGPATGVHYEELKRDFDERIKALLAEPAPG